MNEINLKWYLRTTYNDTLNRLKIVLFFASKFVIRKGELSVFKMKVHTNQLTFKSVDLLLQFSDRTLGKFSTGFSLLVLQNGRKQHTKWLFWSVLRLLPPWDGWSMSWFGLCILLHVGWPITYFVLFRKIVESISGRKNANDLNGKFFELKSIFVEKS